MAVNRDAAAEVLRAAVGYTRNSPNLQFQLKRQDRELEGLVEGLACTPWRDSYLLELPENPEKLRLGNSVSRHRIKWAVSKAVKLGVQVRPAENEVDLRSWYALYLGAMRRNAVPPRAFRFFEALWRALYPKRMMRILLAELHGGGGRTLLAGSIFLLFNRTVTYAFTGCKREALSYHANDLIQWHAITDACRNGFQRYDFGEVPEDHHRLAQFKGKWGAEAVPLYRYYYPAQRAGASGDTPAMSGTRRALTAVWQRLPLRATAVLGDWLYSRL